jgi:hypothetical protein
LATLVCLIQPQTNRTDKAAILCQSNREGDKLAVVVSLRQPPDPFLGESVGIWVRKMSPVGYLFNSSEALNLRSVAHAIWPKN